MSQLLAAPALAPVELDPLEIAGGVPLGFDRNALPLPELPRDVTPLSAFEDAIRPALARPPCIVTFSGGRDSSAIIAVATRIARSEGLEPPIALTLRLRDALGSGEAEWQERVVSHLGLADWVVLEAGEEIDYVGPLAQKYLLRHGVRHPAASPLFAAPLERARGGSLLTGFGGDAVVGGWLQGHFADVRAGRARIGRQDAQALGFAWAPQPLRRAVMRTRLTLQPWLTPQAARRFQAVRAAEFASRPVAWDRFLQWESTLRRGHVFEESLALLGRDADALVAHPLHDRRFMAALARAGGRRGLGDRTAVMRAVFRDELPDDVLSRPAKANFSLAYFRSHTRAFARRWDGQGLDPEIVDAEKLRAASLELLVDQRCALVLQAAWLDSARRGLEQGIADSV